MIVVPQDVIMRRPARALDSLMRAKIKVELGRMSDADVDRRSGRNVPGLSGLFFLV
jgi:hypothetical protein